MCTVLYILEIPDIHGITSPCGAACVYLPYGILIIVFYNFVFYFPTSSCVYIHQCRRVCIYYRENGRA